MINKELRKLSRKELVDVIYQLKKNEQKMQEKIDKLEAELNDKRIRLDVAGSIAEAATSITNIFSTAQSTADLYLHEISCIKQEAENEAQKIIINAKSKAEEILADGQKKYDDLNSRYQSDYKKWEKLKEKISLTEKQNNA